MENSTRYGLVAVFAVSGSVVFLVHQLHKRLLSNFMRKFEIEMASEKHQAKKKVRFAEEVIELPLRKAKDGVMEEELQKWRHVPKLEDIVPPNRAVLYRGIIKHKVLNDNLRF